MCVRACVRVRVRVRVDSGAGVRARACVSARVRARACVCVRVRACVRVDVVSFSLFHVLAFTRARAGTRARTAGSDAIRVEGRIFCVGDRCKGVKHSSWSTTLVAR